MPQEPRYWFPAKRMGWGWGPPTVWEGWAVIVAYVLAVLLGASLFPPAVTVPGFVAYVVALTLALFAICWLKGEPPKWRWGGRE